MKLPGPMDNPQPPRPVGQLRQQQIVVPVPSTPQGGRWRLVKSFPLVQNTVVAEPGSGTKVATAYMDLPSVRLHAKIAFGFKSTDGQTIPLPSTGPTAWRLNLDAWDRTEDGILVPTNRIIGSVPLPTSYEAITANDRWVASVTIPDLGDGNGANMDADGQLYVISCWEPAPGWNGDPEQLAKIFQACNLVPNGASVTS